MKEAMIQKGTIMTRTTTLALLGLACLTAMPSIAHARYQDGMNLYGYAGENPTVRTDAQGLAWRRLSDGLWQAYGDTDTLQQLVVLASKRARVRNRPQNWMCIRPRPKKVAASVAGCIVADVRDAMKTKWTTTNGQVPRCGVYDTCNITDACSAVSVGSSVVDPGASNTAEYIIDEPSANDFPRNMGYFIFGKDFVQKKKLNLTMMVAEVGKSTKWGREPLRHLWLVGHGQVLAHTNATFHKEKSSYKDAVKAEFKRTSLCWFRHDAFVWLVGCETGQGRHALASQALVGDNGILRWGALVWGTRKEVLATSFGSGRNKTYKAKYFGQEEWYTSPNRFLGDLNEGGKNFIWHRRP